MKELGEKDEAVTPAGRLFLQPQMEQVINCAVGLQHPLNLQSLKDSVRDSIMAKHPRFRSLFLKDKHGREYWRVVDKVDIDEHVFEPTIRSVDASLGDEEFINAYLADLSVSTPLSTDKPLWEIHVLEAQKCCIVRIHHSLGDGVSLMSLFLTCCRRVGHPDELPNIPGATSVGSTSSKRSIFEIIWRWVMMGILTLVYVLKFMGRSLWVKDEKTIISGGDGVELWPRKLATAKFRLEDMKLVKNAIHNGVSLTTLATSTTTSSRALTSATSSRSAKAGMRMVLAHQ